MLGFYNYTAVLSCPGRLCPAALPFRLKKPALGKKDAPACEEVDAK